MERIKKNERLKDKQHGKRKHCMVNSREKQEIQDQRRWLWLKAGQLKRETESLTCAAQEQTLKTNAVKNGIDHQYLLSLWRLCKKKVESIIHVVSSCSVLAGNQYRKRHNKLGKKVHCLLCKKLEIKCEDKRFSNQPEPLGLCNPDRSGNRTSKPRHCSYW